MKVRFHLGIGYTGADHEEDVEFPDDVNDREISDSLMEWIWNYIECSAEKLK